MTGQDAVDRAYEHIGCGYGWAAQGQWCTPDFIKYLVSQFGRNKYYKDGYSVEKWMWKKIFDCSGFVLEMYGIRDKDDTAEGIYKYRSIPIKRSELRNGDLCFKKNFVHIGIYADGGIINAKSTFSGVVFDKWDKEYIYFSRPIKVADPELYAEYLRTKGE